MFLVYFVLALVTASIGERHVQNDRLASSLVLLVMSVVFTFMGFSNY